MKLLPLSRRWVQAKPGFRWCSSSSVTNTYGCSACWFWTRGIKAMHMCLLATVCVLTVRQGLGSEDRIRSTSAHKGMLGLLQSHTSHFCLLLYSFTEQINNLATTPSCRKVLVPFPAEWQAAPPAGRRAAEFRLLVCKVSRLVALGCSSTVRDLKERKHSWWQLIAWWPGGLSQAHSRHKCHFWFLRRAERV